jgi:DHA1 family multidrug resistance protein-like MFS transporter
MAEAPRQSWHRTLYIVFFAQLMTAVGFSSIFPFLPLYVESLGTSTSLSLELLAGLVFSAQAFTMMLASPIWGALADRSGRKVMVERAAFGGAVLLLMMAYVRSAEQLVALRAIQGFVTGTLAASNALVAASVPRERTGYAMGLLQTALGTGWRSGRSSAARPRMPSAIGRLFIDRRLLFLAGLLVLFGVKEEFVPLEALAEPTAVHQPVAAHPSPSRHHPRLQHAVSDPLGRMMLIPIAPLFIRA